MGEYSELVLAPRLGSTEPGKESKKLRVYAYGGLIGEIPTIQREEGALADAKYLPEGSEERIKLEKMLGCCRENVYIGAS